MNSSDWTMVVLMGASILLLWWIAWPAGLTVLVFSLLLLLLKWQRKPAKRP